MRYVVVRAHGLKTHLLDKETYTKLSRARNLEEIVSALSGTEYSEEISKVPVRELSARILGRIFRRILSNRFFGITKIAWISGEISLTELFSNYSKRFEVENIKMILRAKHGKTKINEDVLIPIPREYLMINFPALIGAKDVQEVVSMLRETIYRGLLDYLDVYGETGSVAVLEAVLDKIYYENVWESIHKTKIDIKDVKEIVGLEIDLKNLYTVVSLKKIDLAPELIEKVLIKYYFRIKLDELKEVARGPIERIAEIIRRLPYVELGSKIPKLLKEENYSLFEDLILKILFRKAGDIMKACPDTLGYVFGYLILCEREYRNLIRIVEAIELGIGEKISERIL